MTNKIALTASMRSNLLSLKNTQSLLDKTQDRLSSGYRVNSAMDNPSSYFTAQALNSRANDLSTLLDSIGQAISTLEVADQGITTLQSYVEQAKSVANSARDTSNVASSVSSDNVTFNAATAKTDKLSSYLNDITAGDSFTIRLGDSTKMEGTSNVSKDMTLEEIGITDGMKMEMIVGDKTYNFNFSTAVTSDAVDNGDGTFTQNINVADKLENFMNDAVYTVGRKVLNAKVEDGKLSFNTMDNSSLMIRSSMAAVDTVSNPYTYRYSEGDLQALASQNAAGTEDIASGTLKIGGKAFTVASNTTVDELAEQINGDLGLNDQGIYAMVDGTNLVIYSEKNIELMPEATTAPAVTHGTAEDQLWVGGTSNVKTGDATAEGEKGVIEITADEMRAVIGTAGDDSYTDEVTGANDTVISEGIFMIQGDTGFGGVNLKLTKAMMEGLLNDVSGTVEAINALSTTTGVTVNWENNKLTITTTDDAAAGDADNLKATATKASFDAASDGTAIPTGATPAPVAGTVNKMSSFNDVLGFDSGYSVTIKQDMTVEQFRQALEDLGGISADFDAKGHLVVSGEQGDDMLIADRSGNTIRSLLGDSIVSATNGSNERATYSKQFDNLLTQMDQLVQDTSYKGVNLLNGDSLLVNFNESRTSSLNIKGVSFNSVGLGFTMADNEWKDNDSIDKALNQITKATSLLRAQASEFGQNLSTVQIREDFTQNMINNLQSGADKLTLADMNEEAANMLALQTRQQLGVNSLSLASQTAQSVLQLF